MEFQGFQPNTKVQDVARRIWGHISDDSPSDAYLKACIEKTQEGFRGLFEVTSVAGRFGALVLERDPLSALEQLEKKILQQIQRWRSGRQRRLTCF